MLFSLKGTSCLFLDHFNNKDKNKHKSVFLVNLDLKIRATKINK